MKKILSILICLTLIGCYISMYNFLELKGSKREMVYCVRDSLVVCAAAKIDDVREISSDGLYQIDIVRVDDYHIHYIAKYLY